MYRDAPACLAASFAGFSSAMTTLPVAMKQSNERNKFCMKP
jgi:hypothetical protein